VLDAVNEVSARIGIGEAGGTILEGHPERDIPTLTASLQQVGGRFLVTADHGNCDEMVT
jgi:bisphosphoglycerate-independent phosphoglycerate mutase (AlkP superfamily)